MLKVNRGPGLLWLLLLTESQVVASPVPMCTVDIPAFDALGILTPLTVVSVTPEGKDINLLNVREVTSRVVARGSRLQFPKALLGRQFRIGLRDSRGKIISPQRLYLMSCPQRMSLRVGGQQDLGVDVAVSVVTGRIVGCSVDEKWWVRMMPMFGSLEGGLNHEGTIDEKGVLTIISSVSGERHIVVVGKDRDPIKAVGVNVIVGAKNSIGDIKLSLCPP